MNEHVYIIADTGAVHYGSDGTAEKLIEKAAESGADAVKLRLADIQTDDIRLHTALNECAAQCGIDLMPSPVCTDSIDAFYKLGFRTFRVPSGEVTNLPYLRKLAELNSRYIISTGMCTMMDVVNCMRVFTAAECPLDNVTLLHVTTQHPARYGDVNLRAMITLGDTIGVRYGYSDHTPGIEVPIAAAALGASVIEKQFTLGRATNGPEHAAFLEPDELAAMVRSVRNIEQAVGDGIKRPSPGEKGNIDVVRRSIAAARPIKKGEKLTEENITAKRPGTGISPMKWDEIIGRTANRDYNKDELIEY